MYQRSRKKGYIGWVVAVLVLIVVLNLPATRDFPPLKFTRQVFQTVLYPFQSTARFLVSSTKNTFEAMGNFFAVSGENEKLKKKLREISAQNLVREEALAENQRLRRALKFQRINIYELNMIPAEVIAHSASNWFSSVQINKGKKHGVREDMAVINSSGVVGRVVVAGLFSSRVLLLTDPSSAISGRIHRTHASGIVDGRLGEPLLVRYVPSQTEVKIGDKVVASAASEFFPRGVPLGIVAKVKRRKYDLFQRVELKPAVDISNLDKVFVVK